MAIAEDTQYGVTPQGFVRMRLPEIQKNLFDRLDAKLGISVSRKPNSLVGVLVGLVAEESDRQWQLEEADYYDRSPVSAGDGSIDNTLAYTNVLRKSAERTYLYAVCYGRSGMVLPSNCQIKDNQGYKFTIYKESVISLSDCVSVTMTIASVTAGAVYKIIFNSDKVVSYTAVAGDTLSKVYVELLKQDSGVWKGSTDGNNLVYEQDDRRYGGIVTPTETFSIISVGSPIRFDADEYGPIEPELKAVNSINTNYDGWTAVSNESESYVGRNAETATEVRQRYASAVYSKSVGMKESIKAALLELQDVKSVTVYENRSDETVDGMKPHSFEVIILGGDEERIARRILDVAPLGIDTNGSIAVDIFDEDNTMERICFSRPQEVPVYLKVIIHEYEEEVLPGDLVDKIKAVIVEQGSKLSMGNDVVYQRFIGPIYTAVPGIGYIDLTIGIDGVTYKGENIPISRGQIATFDATRISVGIET